MSIAFRIKYVFKNGQKEHDVRLQHNADYYACSKLQTQQHDGAVAALCGQIQD